MKAWMNGMILIQSFNHSISLKNSYCSLPTNFLLHSPCLWAPSQYHRTVNNFQWDVGRVSYKAQRFYQSVRSLSKVLIPELLYSFLKNNGSVQ